MSFGLRLTLFPCGSEAGLAPEQRPPLAFFLGIAPLGSPWLLLPELRPTKALAEEDRREKELA